MESFVPTIDSLIELATPADPQIAPDGSAIAYVISQPDWEEDRYVNQIWLVANAAEAEPRQLTFTKNGSATPHWSPDGQYLAFLSERDGDKGAQIYRLAINGGEAERLTELETSIQNLQWSPDGQTIAFTAVPPESAADKARTEKYGEYVEDNVDYQRSQLWLLTLDGKKVRQLTAGDDLHIMDLRWHPDSQLLAFTAAPTPDMDQYLHTRNYLLDVNSLEMHPITAAFSNSPRWSPDGSKLVYVQRTTGPGAFFNNNWLEILTVDDESSERITLTFDEDVSPLIWSAAGIYFWAFQRTTAHLFRVPATGGAAVQVTPDDLPGFVATDYSFSRDDAQCGLVYTDVDTGAEVATLDLATGDLERRTTYDMQTAEWDLPRHELYTWTSLDGTEIEGVLTRPHNFDPEQQYPLLVMIHGGPTGISLWAKAGRAERRMYPVYQWVQQGTIVLQPNYRGSAGYGEAFRSLNVRDLGTGDYADVISGVDALIAEGWVDADRVGAMGWSQGGYISAFITTYSDRFKAVSVGAGISNWMTYYVNTDVHPFTLQYLEATPWDDPDIYAKTSPMTYIKQAQTPTLIQHGEKDARVPIPNAFELHQGLLDQGVESKLVVYPGMPHGPTRPKQNRHIMNDNYAWFNRRIFGIEADEVDPAPLYIVVPGADENSTLTADVTNIARRDHAMVKVFTTDGTLSDDISTAATTPTIDDATAIVKQLTAQFAEIGMKQIIVYTERIEDNSSVLIPLGCVQIAAGSIGGITVEHRAGISE